MPPKTKIKPKKYAPVLQLPPLSTEESDGLKASIAVHGVIVPILLTEDGRIIDGDNRKRIADELGYDCPEIVQKGLAEDEIRALARSLNLARRQLNRVQRRQLVADQLRETSSWSNRRVAKLLGVDHQTIGASGLSTALGISRNTASKLTKELSGMGLISETKIIDTPPMDWFRPRVKSRKWSELDAKTKAEKTITSLQAPEWEQWVNQQVEYAEGKTFDLRRVVVREMEGFAKAAYESGWSRLNVLDILSRTLRVNTRWMMWKPADVILDRIVVPLFNSSHAPIRDPGFGELTEAKQKFARIAAWREFSNGWNRAMNNLNKKMKDMVASGWYNWGV